MNDSALHQNIYFVSGMWCSSCARGVRDAVTRIDGVTGAEINFASKLLVVEFGDEVDGDALDRQVCTKIDQIGFGIKKQTDGWVLGFGQDLSKELNARLSWTFVATIWFLAMWSSMLAFARYAGGDLEESEAFHLAVASSIFGLPAILLGIRSYIESGWRALRYTYSLNLDFFIALGGLSATVVSLIALVKGDATSYADSGSMIIAILLLTKKIENEAVKKVTSAILFELHPGRSHVSVQKKGQWREGLSSQVKKGDRVQFEKNETILFDGTLRLPEGKINAHLLSGEDRALPLRLGDPVYAGSIALERMEISVSAPLGCRRIDDWAVSALSGGVRRSRYGKIVARLERALTTVALTGAIAAAAFVSFRGASFAETAETFFIGVLALCPCLFASILPLAKQIAHLALLRAGIAVSRTEALLDLCDVRTFYFDKTGTLEAVRSHFEAFEAANFNPALLEELASKSRHPILRGLEKRNDAGLLSAVTEFPGQGVVATTQDGSSLIAGSASFLERQGIHIGEDFDRDFPGVAYQGRLKGQIIIKKVYDVKARYILERLLRLVPRSKIEILSGDPALGAGERYRSLGEQVVYRGSLTPEQKAERIQPRSAFIGDGLNDILALSRADVSFRIGERVTGFAPVDFQLQITNLDLICLTIEYAKRFRRVLLQTFLAAFIYNVAALTLVALELFSPLGAVVAMLFSFSVLFFSVLRLSKWEV